MAMGSIAWSAVPSAAEPAARAEGRPADERRDDRADSATDALIRLHREVVGHYVARTMVAGRPDCCEVPRALR